VVQLLQTQDISNTYAACPNVAELTKRTYCEVAEPIAKGKQTSLMETAMATLLASGRTTCARLLFNSCAAMSLVTSETARALKARRIYCPIHI